MKRYGKDVWEHMNWAILYRAIYQKKSIYHDVLQTHHVYSTLKRHGNGRFHVVSMWNTRVVFVGRLPQNVLCTGNITSKPDVLRCFNGV